MHSATYLFSDLVLIDKLAASIISDLARRVRFDNIEIQRTHSNSRRRRKGVVDAQMILHYSARGKGSVSSDRVSPSQSGVRYRMPKGGFVGYSARKSKGFYAKCEAMGRKRSDKPRVGVVGDCI